MYRIYLKRFDLSITQNGLFAHGGCIREAMSCFAVSTARKCTSVHDRRGAAARREIDRGAPPTVRLLSQHL